MIFKPFNIEKMLRNEKDQTRRIAKPGDTAVVSRTLTLADFAINANEHGSTVSGEVTGGEVIVRVVNGKRTVYEVGKTVAICPGRGKRSTWYYPGKEPVIMLDDRQSNGMPYSDADLRTTGYVQLRIRIVAIRRQRPCDISEADARAEGFAGREEFFEAWKKINGPNKLDVDCWCLTFEGVS